MMFGMKEIIMLLAMIFLHILDDFCLQGVCLSNLKQKKWWEENYPQEMYKKDYSQAMITHAFSWSFMIFIPVMVYLYFKGILWTFEPIIFIFFFLFNLSAHAIIDDMKANHNLINLCQDQKAHMVQIFITWVFFVCSAYIVSGGA